VRKEMKLKKKDLGIIASVVSLKLLYNDNRGCHSRENGNPAEKTGFPRIKYGAGLIKSGMTFCVKSFLRQYTSSCNNLLNSGVIALILCPVVLRK
jgi:hypothetical protein